MEPGTNIRENQSHRIAKITPGDLIHARTLAMPARLRYCRSGHGGGTTTNGNGVL